MLILLPRVPVHAGERGGTRKEKKLLSSFVFNQAFVAGIGVF